MNVEEHVPLAPLTTLQVGGPARYLARVLTEEDLLEAFAWARHHGVPVAVLGGGSNLLVDDAGYSGLVVHLGATELRSMGLEQRGEVFDVAAGESWDALVDATVAADCAGMECLAGIPGTVGASPVQNIGAYGQEVAQTIESVRALDRRTGDFVELPASACGFRYRQSVFNSQERGRYVITRVRFRLRPGGTPSLAYAELQRWFADRQETPTLASVAAAVRQIRRGKGMVLDRMDHDTWSAGSYFKNPIVTHERLAEVAGKAGVPPEAVPHWPAGDGTVKLSAAWLLERAGFTKGYRLGPVGLSTKHALAVINRGGATGADVLRLESVVCDGVSKKLGVVLEREPVDLGS